MREKRGEEERRKQEKGLGKGERREFGEDGREQKEKREDGGGHRLLTG